MGKTVEELQEALRRFETESANDQDFARLRDFYLEMGKKGLLLKKEYDLPLIDTIGRTVYLNEPK
jgi:hypothetical protein